MKGKFTLSQKAKFFSEIRTLCGIVEPYHDGAITKETVLHDLENIERPFTYSQVKWIVKFICNVFPTTEEIKKACDSQELYDDWLRREREEYRYDYN